MGFTVYKFLVRFWFFSIFYTLQLTLLELKLVLNANQTKYSIFTRSRSMTTAPSILTIDGLHIERVTAYKYLGI